MRKKELYMVAPPHYAMDEPLCHLTGPERECEFEFLFTEKLF